MSRTCPSSRTQGTSSILPPLHKLTQIETAGSKINVPPSKRVDSTLYDALLEFTKLNLTLDGRLPATSINASLLYVDATSSGIQMRYHEVIERAIKRFKESNNATGSDAVEDQSNSPVDNNSTKFSPLPPSDKNSIPRENVDMSTWTAWFKEHKSYIGVKSQLKPTKDDNVRYGRFYFSDTSKDKEVSGASSDVTVIFVDDHSSASDQTLAFLTSISNGTHIWFINTSDSVEMEKFVLGRGAKRQRSSKQTLTAESQPTSLRTLTLPEEYDTHCQWLRLIQQPSAASTNLEATPYVDTLSREEYLGMVGNEFAKELSEMDQKEGENITNGQLLQQMVSRINSIKSSELKPPIFKKFDAVDGERYIAWLKLHMLSEVGTVYQTMGRDLELAQRLLDDPYPTKDKYKLELEGLTVEHLTPESWTRATKLFREFNQVILDPVTLATDVKSVNSSRSNRAIALSANAPEAAWDPMGLWRVGRQALVMRQFVARAIVYSTLTYPLLSSSVDGAFVKSTNFQSSTSYPSGINSYADQFDTIISLATSLPQNWEVRIAARCWTRFGVVNPIVVSQQTRDALNTPTHPLRELLRARFEGRDLCSVECLRTLQAIIQQLR